MRASQTFPTETLADLIRRYRHTVEFTLQPGDAAVGKELREIRRKLEEIGVDILRIVPLVRETMWRDEIKKGEYDDYRLQIGDTIVLGTRGGILSRAVEYVINGKLET